MDTTQGKLMTSFIVSPVFQVLFLMWALLISFGAANHRADHREVEVLKLEIELLQRQLQQTSK